MNSLLVLLMIFSPYVHAVFQLNNGLTTSDREKITRILGVGTTSKNMTSPRPLGSDNGLEISFMMEVLDIDNVSQFILSPQNNKSLYYPKFLIGKGLFESTDVFFHFIPYTESLGLSEVGGVLRYNFYVSSHKLFFASIILNANSANFNNQFIGRNVGGDLLVGLDWNHFSVFSTVGHVGTTGKFTGGTFGVTDSLRDENESANALHLSFGAVYQYSILSLGISYDQFIEQVYSIKLGLTL